MKILIQELIEKGRLKTPEIIKAFEKINRLDFVGEENQDYAYYDEALPIGKDQTISQPTTVAIMLELLQPEKGDQVLDIGFGSGWTTALLAEIVGSKGKVYAVEIIQELYRFGKKNIEKYHFENVKFFNQDASGGLAEFAPHDRILASAAVDEIPQPLKEQLKIKGILVLPVQDEIIKMTKINKNKFESKNYPFFAFVPMKGKYSKT
jgi:protein-L-isoaspartate(D-aspartate) O-methyltransferase